MGVFLIKSQTTVFVRGGEVCPNWMCAPGSAPHNNNKKNAQNTGSAQSSTNRTRGASCKIYIIVLFAPK